MTANVSLSIADDGAVIVVALARPQQQAATPQQQTDAQIRDQIRQSAAEIRRTALENARAQLEAQRSVLEQQRASIEAQRSAAQNPDVPAIPAPPALPGAGPRVTITRDGKAVFISRDGKTVTINGDGGAATVAQTGADPNLIFRPEIPQGAVWISIAFFLMIAIVAVGLPLARAWARRMDRQSAPAPYPLDVTDRLERIEHAVEAVAIEVERISEGQRFTTKLLTERGESAPAAAVPTTSARSDGLAGGGGR